MTILYIAALLVGLGCLVGSSTSVNADVTTIKDDVVLDVEAACSFVTVGSASADGGDYIASSAGNSSEVTFAGGHTHVFNVACAQVSGYTVTAYATDLARSGGGGAITFVNYDSYDSTKSANPSDGIWSAELVNADTGAVFGTSASPAVIKSSAVASAVDGDEFSVNYMAYVGSSTPAGTYSGEAVYTLTMNPLPNYDWSITYNGGAAGASATDLPATQSGTSAPRTDTTVVLSSTAPSYAGATFLGWSTDSSATTATYTPGQSITIPWYRPTLTLYAVWERTTFQAFTASDCSNITTGSTIPVQDTRDDKLYLVSRLADGNCWMVQNLALAPGTTITSADSDVATSYTIPTTTTFYYSGTGSEESDWEDQSAILPTGDSGYIAATRNGYDASGNADNSKNTGAYYTYNTAVAGTNAGSSNQGAYAPASICPKGWRLPTNGEQTALLAAYNDSYDDFAPVWGSALVGGYSGGSLGGSGVLSIWWSGARYSNYNRAYALGVEGGGVGAVYDRRVLGASVRCMFGARP